jgi:hypothetical protein
MLPSEYVPIALSWRAMPTPVEKGLGWNVIDWTMAGLTVTDVLPDVVPEVAVIIAGGPSATAVATPLAAFTVADAGVSDVQVTLVVKSAVLASVNVPVALNCWVKPSGRFGLDGVTASETRPRTKDTLPILVAPVSKYAVRTPFGNVPAADETATTSPVLTCTAPETGVPLTESWPAETETDDPA